MPPISAKHVTRIDVRHGNEGTDGGNGNDAAKSASGILHRNHRRSVSPEQ